MRSAKRNTLVVKSDKKGLTTMGASTASTRIGGHGQMEWLERCSGELLAQCDPPFENKMEKHHGVSVRPSKSASQGSHSD